MTELGLYVRLDTPAETIRTLAWAAEEAGYRCFWMNNPPGQDGLTPLSWAAQATSRITLGSGVIPVSVFTPTAILDQLARLGLPRERYRLGIGSGAGPHPIQRVRAALRELRPRAGCELVLAALGPRMCELAGQEADAVLLNALTLEYARQSGEVVRAAAAAAGRPRPRIYALVPVAVGAAALAVAERTAAFYGQLPAYVAHFQRMGVAALDTIIRVDHSEDLADQLAAWRHAVDELVIGPLLASGQPDEALAIVRAAPAALH